MTHRSCPRRTAALALAALAAAALPSAAMAKCVDEEVADTRTGGPNPAPKVDQGTPRMMLQGLVRQAIARSNAIGAANLLAEAAQADIDETRALGKPQAQIGLSVGAATNAETGLPTTTGLQERAFINLGAPIYDSGRVAQLTGWRNSLADAARQGQLGAQEQIGLQTVSLALERSRYKLQAQVYQQYARKMSCLVDALQQIVASDRGRTSELLQAQKSLQQAELSRTQTLSQVVQSELRLRRFVGDDLPTSDGLSSVLVEVPPLAEMQAAIERTPDIAQLAAQANAQDAYARATAASGKPQLNWVLTGSKAHGAGNQTSLLAGVNVSIPILNPGIDASITAAQKRAEATRLQRLDAVEALKFRMADVHEQAVSAFDRARRSIATVRDSDQVRNYTLQQWQQLGKRSLFDVMSSEAEYYNLRVSYVNALYDGEQSVALLWSLGAGIFQKLQ